MDLGINTYGNTCTYMEAEYLQKEENSYHIWLTCLVFFFLVLIEIYQNSFMLRFHVMICDRRSKIVFIIYYNNKCPTGYTIKLRYTDAWYDYVIKGTDARL